jgi:hypothetical protein
MPTPHTPLLLLPSRALLCLLPCHRPAPASLSQPLMVVLLSLEGEGQVTWVLGAFMLLYRLHCAHTHTQTSRT